MKRKSKRSQPIVTISFPIKRERAFRGMSLELAFLRAYARILRGNPEVMKMFRSVRVTRPTEDASALTIKLIARPKPRGGLK